MDLMIMSGNTLVGRWIENKLEIINDSLLPVQLKNTNDVIKWLETRAIDTHRANSRLLKKALRLSEKDDFSVTISVNGLTITDNYWVKPLGSPLSYESIKFDNDYFSSLALNGNYDSFNKAANSKYSRTPELTNTGSFEKCWKLKNGIWWMYKKANHKEMFSELFVAHLGNALGFNMACYERGQGYIKTKDFTNDASVNFEPAYSFMADNEDYIENLKALRSLNPLCIKDYVQLLFLDTICANPDRHTFNYGVLRDINNGEILGLAPNFDNNMALISRGYPKNLNRTNDLLIKLFNELLNFDNSLKEYIPKLSEKTIEDIIKRLNMRVRTTDIIEFVMNGYNKINI